MCGDDGVIRLYPDESFKCPTVPAYFYLDRELRIDIEQAKKVDLHDPTSHSLEQSAIAQRVDLHSMANVLLLPELGIQYVVSFNDNGK